MDMLRTSCVIGAIIFAFPVPHRDQLTAALDGSSNWQFMSRASEQFSDLASFCNMQPGACATVEYVADSVQAKARYGTQLFIDWVDEATSQSNDMITSIQAYADTIQTGSTSQADPTDLRGPLYPDKG